MTENPYVLDEDDGPFVLNFSGVLGTFSSRHSYEQLKHIAMNQGVLFPEDGDGEQSLPCFCGD